MSTEKITLTFLKEKVWWWNWDNIRQHGVPGVGWDKEAKEAAHNYELMRRSPKGKQHYAKTYLELNSQEKVFVHILWCNWPESPWRFATQHQQFNEIGWTPVFPNPPIQWNLRLPDAVLTKAFMREIEIQRGIQQICPTYHRKGTKNKEPHWSEIEILDRNENKTDKFLPTEWGVASNAKRKAATFCSQFRCSLSQWARSMRLHKNPRDGEEYELVLDLRTGVNRVLAKRRHLAEKLQKNVPLGELYERFPELLNEAGASIKNLQFFNFKIVYWEHS